MDTGLIITIIIFVVVSIVILKIVTKLIKAVLMILIIAFLITSIFGFFTYQDSVELKNNLENELNLVLLQDNEKIVAGFVATDFEEEAEFLRISQVAEYQNSFKKQDYKKMLGDNYKMFIIEIKAFDFDDEKVYFIGKRVSKNFLYSVLKSNDPINLYRIEIGINPSLDGISDPVEFKSQVFAVLFSEAIEKKGTFFIFSEYKKKNIIVYPETAVFKFIGLIPTAFVKKMFEEAKDSAINKINQTIKG
ncbi:hypothetical protein AUJ83_00680 [Candidatus Woesearchaeota archaeon CG1_02_33_12]|nr:MAG: hypothetical protein AUJ83_00680 [Candidatus Woesearchaeota archaeon CG1_02_33_12]